MTNKNKFLVIFILILVCGFTIWQIISSNQSAQTEFKTSGAMKSLDWWNTQRAYPNESIPQAGYEQAFKYAKYNMNSSDKELGYSGQWKPIGPHNIGGRTLSLALNPQNPNTIYAGSASGGLWRSKSAGKGADAWEQVSTGFPVLGVGAIAIHPADSNTIFIGTGEVYNYTNTQGGVTVRETRGSYGIGILKTIDGGISWIKSLDWSYNQQRAVHVIRINPLNPNTIWAGTTEGTFRSTNAGQSWILVNSTIMVTDLVINPVDTNIVYVACGNLGSSGHGIYRTLDSGNQWTKLTNGLPSTFGGKVLLSIYESSPNIVYASIGNGYWTGAGTWLCKTENNGDSWITVSALDYATYQGWFAHDVTVHPTDSNIVVTMGVDIWKSTTGGSLLSQKSQWNAWYFGQTIPGQPEGPPWYSHADHHDVIRHPTCPDTIYFANDGGVFRSLDGGETFEGCNGGYQSTQFYPGFTCSPQDSMHAIGGMQDNSTAIYDGTVAWIRVIGGDGSWTAINPTDDDVIYGSLQGLTMYRSEDRGNFWSYISPGNPGSVGFIAPFALGGPANPDLIYAGGSYILKSTNRGNSWTTANGGMQLDGNPALSIAVSQNNSNIVYATTAPVFSAAGIFYSNNSGTTFTNITDTLPNRYPMDIAIDPNDDTTVYVVFSGFGTSHIFKSTDSGTSWQDIGAGLPDVPTTAVIVDPLYPNQIYIGNDLGVFVSTNGGTTWETFQEGLPDAVMAMDLSISPVNRKLRVATHGNGAYVRKLLPDATGIEISQSANPVHFNLKQNYPNPFNPDTKISYSVSKTMQVSLIIYNTLGQEIIRLVDSQFIGAGNYDVTWNGTNAKGLSVSAGTYICKIVAGNKLKSIKMSLMK